MGGAWQSFGLEALLAFFLTKVIMAIATDTRAVGQTTEACPCFSNARHQVHWGFPNPSQVQESEEEQPAIFRHIHDQIAAKIDQFLNCQLLLSLEEVYAAAKAKAGDK